MTDGDGGKLDKRGDTYRKGCSSRLVLTIAHRYVLLWHVYVLMQLILYRS